MKFSLRTITSFRSQKMRSHIKFKKILFAVSYYRKTYIVKWSSPIIFITYCNILAIV